jgi:hypothetical protein
MTTAMSAILLAVSANTLSKAIIALVCGCAAFGTRVVVGLSLMMVALWGSVTLSVGWVQVRLSNPATVAAKLNCWVQ